MKERLREVSGRLGGDSTARSKDNAYPWLGGFLGLSYAAAGLGGLFTSESVNSWYKTLRRPSWNPPDWVFGPVWSVLYTLMAVSAWLVRREMKRDPLMEYKGRTALFAWVGQLILNVAWSGVFFGKRDPRGALDVIAALWSAIAATIGLSARVKRPAGLMLIPYLAWTSFAALLNYKIYRMNRYR